MHGREITSLSFTALGFFLVLVAVVLAAASLIMLFKPGRKDDERAQRVQDRHWVMLQDKKKLEACLAEQGRQRQAVQAELAAAGLSEAKDSLRHARALLDEAKDVRAENALYVQRKQALVSRRTALEESLEKARETREGLYAEIGMRRERGTLEAVDAFIARKTRQREGLMETSEHLNRRYGELRQLLSQAKGERSFDELKLQAQQLQTRRDEAAMEFAKLLLARHMLEAAIASWESKSQPEVYARASELLGLMTEGKWVKVSSGDRCAAHRARARASIVGHVPAAVPGAAHRAARHRRQRGTCRSHHRGRHPGELRFPASCGRGEGVGPAGSSSPGHSVDLP